MFYSIDVNVKTDYLKAQSLPEKDRYVFSYTITIRNSGDIAAKLISRHWVITDANGKKVEVKGEGVVGQQPFLNPGDAYQYTSGAIIETPLGSMHGSYQMIAEDGKSFDAVITPFTLSIPMALH
ncbi:MAG: Co2+/Mg2+ efflux protein ApaG [Methylococcales bacterium]|jgi:ApaG protein|nr:Co2+/Mg2+ efflux protein ApaG [Methylococcales bacterium]MBT7408773.1 Co2+/Mg2+ efflux protein ApaG [Methylococcales bacterium]